jgi:hydroxymethylpyrimidine kinase/phosphomethylpyrimidine kinase
MKRILTIAGSDSGGGAGIQADLKTITLLGGYGMTVMTALTAQNTVSVQGIHEIPARFVEKQIDSVLSDIGADAVKTGMLVNREIVEVVSEKIRQYHVKKVVVDPVMVSKNGALLLRKEAYDALIKRLIPLAWVITPNLMEASALTGITVDSLEKMKRAARQIYNMGARHVIVKGGHLPGKAIDLLFNGNHFYEMTGPRITQRHTHGTGCMYASAVATFLAQGKSMKESARKAKTFTTLAIQSGFRLGKGIGPANPAAFVMREKPVKQGGILESYFPSDLPTNHKR